MMRLLQSKRRAMIFYRFFSHIYDPVNSFFYTDEMRRKLLEVAHVRNVHEVLEVGIGSAWTTEGIASQIGEGSIVGIDLTSEMLMRARRKLRDLGCLHKVWLVQGDVENLPFKDNAFESIVSAGAAEHFPDLKKAIKEMARTAKAEGGITLLVPKKPKTKLLKIFLNPVMAFFTAEDLYAAFKSAGLQRVIMTKTGPRKFMEELAVIIRGEKLP